MLVCIVLCSFWSVLSLHVFYALADKALVALGLQAKETKDEAYEIPSVDIPITTLINLRCAGVFLHLACFQTSPTQQEGGLGHSHRLVARQEKDRYIEHAFKKN